MTESIERIVKKKYRVCLGVCMLAINEKDKIYMIIEFFVTCQKNSVAIFIGISFDFNMRRSKCASFFFF